MTTVCSAVNIGTVESTNETLIKHISQFSEMIPTLDIEYYKTAISFKYKHKGVLSTVSKTYLLSIGKFFGLLSYVYGDWEGYMMDAAGCTVIKYNKRFFMALRMKDDGQCTRYICVVEHNQEVMRYLSKFKSMLLPSSLTARQI